ncbi:hypothetical protein [Pseudoxanthomonas putridarboris]|uniref:DNA-directed RNA polymerase specialized sigma subunit, sigma24 family n=1 Tax=Pseudoxanthomonas putridarboris TaxID=752605 RepID=A0ABU9IWT7_9GAMM
MVSPVPSSPPPAALSAFLRGCERRGAVFAELQCGDPDRGDVALAAALRAFRAHAAELPLADWPPRFWALLAATPHLRSPAPAACWIPSLHALSRAEPLDRAALLLRLAAGLQEEEAAAVLGLAPEDYRQGLTRACPRDPQGRPDAEAWRLLADAIQQHLRDLPPERLARLARLREDALAGTRLPLSHTASTTRSPGKRKAKADPRPRRRWPWVALVLTLVAGALAATWFWPPSWPSTPASPAGTPDGEGIVREVSVRVDALPPVSPPAARFDDEFAAATHPDFALLADPDGEAIARQADFLAWYVASGVPDDATARQEASDARP